jgi:hypothetical protein
MATSARPTGHRCHLRFAVHADFNAYLDGKYSDIVIEEVPISASQALHNQDRLAYRKSLVEFRNRPEEGEDDFAEGETLPEGSDG